MPAASDPRHPAAEGAAWTLADTCGCLEQAIGPLDGAAADGPEVETEVETEGAAGDAAADVKSAASAASAASDRPRKPQPAHAANNKQQPPPQTILRLRFRRGGPAVWLAHLDLMRTVERSVKRADLPVQWSAGFNPRPDLVFALPIGVGLETCADYVDIGLTRDILPEAAPGEASALEASTADASAGEASTADASAADAAGPEAAAGEAVASPSAAELIARLNAALPEGLAIVSGRFQPVEKESIMGRIAFADYQIEAEGIAAAAERAMAEPALVIDKPSKGRTLRVDIRPLILQIAVDTPDQLRLRVRAGSRENLRPDLFLQALVQAGGLAETAAADARLVRTGLYLSARDESLPADPEGNPMPEAPAGCA